MIVQISFYITKHFFSPLFENHILSGINFQNYYKARGRNFTVEQLKVGGKEENRAIDPNYQKNCQVTDR